MRRALCAVISSVFLIVSESGCGGPEDTIDPVAAAIGAESPADEARLDRYVETSARMPHEFVRFVRSLGEADLGAAQTAVDAMTTILHRAEAHAAEFEGRRLRDNIGAYISKQREVVNAYKRMLTYLESDGHEPGRMDDLLAEVMRAKRSLEAVDRRLSRRMADSLPASERDEFWEERRRRIEGLRKKAEAPPGR